MIGSRLLLFFLLSAPDGGVGGAKAPPALAPEMLLVVVPTAGEPERGQPSAGPWSRAIARMVARDLDQLRGGAGRVGALVTLATRGGALGFFLPNEPADLTEAVRTGRKHHAPVVAQLHVEPRRGKVLVDVIDVAARESRFARIYDWRPSDGPPPLAAIERDLGRAAGIAVKDADLARAVWAQTRSAAALEAFAGGLDGLVLLAMRRDRSIGATRAPAELFGEAVRLDPSFAEAQRLLDEGDKARFDKLLVRELRLDRPGPREPPKPPKRAPPPVPSLRGR